MQKRSEGNSFNPMAFLASLGAGGLAVSVFAFLNYSIKHGKGLITIEQTHELISGPLLFVYSSLELLMAIFILVHLGLTVFFLAKLFTWLKTENFKELLGNPLTNNAILAPFISITMTMNVMIGAIRYFVPVLYNNFQALMVPGLIVWGILWVAIMFTEIKLLKVSFVKGFDINKIHFGWLLHPFALGMLTVTGTGIAALSATKSIADIAAFMSLISGTMGLFLFSVKLIALFKSQFAKEGLPEKQFLPSMLVIVPNVTIYAISIFRLGHYLEHHYNAHLGSFFMVVMTTAFAFQLWYMMFGLSLLSDYFKKHFKKEFHITQWGLVCPFVALAVLGSFVYATFSSNIVLFVFIVALIYFTSMLYFVLLAKQFQCARAKVVKVKMVKKASSLICG